MLTAYAIDLLVGLERHSHIHDRMVSLPRYISGTKVGSLLALCSKILARSALHLPGHTASIGNAHPHLVIAKDVPWPGLGRIGCGSGQALGRVALRDRDELGTKEIKREGNLY